MWYRDYHEVSQIKAITAGTVCLVFNTNATKTSVSLAGVPAAPRMTWHTTDTNEVYYFVGFSLQQGESVKPTDYFEEFGGVAALNPEDTKGGTVRWTLSNLMRQEQITLVGDMVIKRVSPQQEIVLE